MVEHGQIGKIVFDPTMTKEEARQKRDYFLEAESHVKGHDARKWKHYEEPGTSSSTKALVLSPQSSSAGNKSVSVTKTDLESCENLEGGENMHRKGKTN